MEDNQHVFRPACVPAPGMGQSELAATAAAVERHSWPAHHATDLEGMSTATSPGLSMLSTLSDSVGGSPVPASPAALWAEARRPQQQPLLQQQQQQQFCELPEAEPVTPSADMRQYLYWQSLQQQQQQLVSTAQYLPDRSSSASSAQMLQQEAESVLRSLPQHILAMSHGTGSHPASPHSPTCAELLHAGQYVDQPSTSRSHDNLRALQLPILRAGSPAQGSARQPALHASPQQAALQATLPRVPPTRLQHCPPAQRHILQLSLATTMPPARPAAAHPAGTALSAALQPTAGPVPQGWHWLRWLELGQHQTCRQPQLLLLLPTCCTHPAWLPLVESQRVRPAEAGCSSLQSPAAMLQTAQQAQVGSSLRCA